MRWLNTICMARGDDIHAGTGKPCGKRQVSTPSGATCEDGHGGAESREMDIMEIEARRGEPLPRLGPDHIYANREQQHPHREMKPIHIPDKLTEYSLRLASGRIVEPGPGGFFWTRPDGTRLGSARDFDWAARELTAGSLGGAHVVLRYGYPEDSLEYIPRESIESLIRRSKS